MRLWKGLVAALAMNGQDQELRAQSLYLIGITYYVMCRNCVCLVKEERITVVSTLQDVIRKILDSLSEEPSHRSEFSAYVMQERQLVSE
jgi:hypothetical protein